MKRIFIIDDNNYSSRYSGGYRKAPNPSKAGVAFFRGVVYVIGFLAGFFVMTIIRGLIGF